MERIKLIKNQLSSSSSSNKKEMEKGYIKSAYDFLEFDEFLTKDERVYRKKLREYLEKNVIPKMPNYLEKQEFPLDIAKDLIKHFPGILGLTNKGYGSAGYSQWLGTAVGMELARADMSLTIFLCVHGGEVVMKSLYLLGSEEQKSYFIPKLMSLEMIGAFCLTEPDYGSDAYSIETSASEDSEGNYIINGHKKWIGQGHVADVYIVWARNEKSGDIEGFIVERTRPGITAKRIEGKIPVRSVQNGEIKFENVKIPRTNKLEKANNFTSSVSKVFLGSRIGCGWSAVGICIGVYDKVIEYCSNRKQFGKPLTSFQLVQEKICRIMGNIQAMMFLCKRITELHMEGKANMGKAGLCKAYCTSKGRETVALGRELLGANGILYENYVMKAFIDMEALHTAEGTYDINILLAGKDITGVQAFI